MRLLATVQILGACARVVDGVALRKPSWGSGFGTTSSFCTSADDATNATDNTSHSVSHENSRWTHYAVPPGAPPDGGWPIYMIFPPWAAAPPPQLTHAACGGPQPRRSCMAYLKDRCHNTWNQTGCHQCVHELMETEPQAFAAAGCSQQQAYEVWCRHHGRSTSRVEVRPPFEAPQAVILPQCFSGKNHTWNATGVSSAGVECGFVSVNGQLWAMRVNQYLLANGVGVIQVNPGGGDAWDSPDGGGYDWNTGKDKPFLTLLFSQIRSGEYAGLGPGVLNIDRLSVSGYSVGAQMVSWIIQLHATGELKAMGATLTAGVMFGGGSYGCYRVPLGSYPDSGPAPLAQCANCNASADCWTVGHSNDILKLTGRQPCCSFCCPQNFTEQYYVDHPERYVDHPPTFLVQATTVDENADADASVNYHNAMVANNGTSELWRIPPEHERCYCIGQADDPAAVDSPLLGQCPKFSGGMAPVPPCNQKEEWCRPVICNPETGLCGAYESHEAERCVSHTMGFAGMVEPLTRFIKKWS